MADEYDSDEDKYANESFETESDTEYIPEQDEQETTDNDDDDEDNDNEQPRPLPPPVTTNGSFVAMYGKRAVNTSVTGNSSGVYRHRRDYATYHSSSDDESDVVISQTIAEINTVPMRMEDADIHSPMTPIKLPRRPITEVTQAIVSEDDTASEESCDDVSETETDNDCATPCNTVIERTTNKLMEDPITSATSGNSESDSDIEGDGDGDSDGIEHEIDTKGCNRPFESQREIMNVAESKIEVITDNHQPTIEDANDDDDGDDDDDGCKEVTSNHTFIQGNSSNKCAIDCEDCIEAAEHSDGDAASEDHLNDYNACPPTVEMHLSSQTPTSFNSDEYTFHMNLIPPGLSNSKTRLKAAHRKSWSFTNVQMREIERQNQILLKKILTQKPTYCLNPPKKNNNNKPPPANNNRITSAAVNRKKQQRQIDLDNQVLKRKIEAISLRRPVL